MGEDVVYVVSRRNLAVWFTIIGIFYLVLTRLDIIVHYELYRFGLQFSLEWAQPYWYVLTACYWCLAALSASSYWLESRSKNIYLVILIVLTILIPNYFGVEDILWFSWRGQFPAESVRWSWYWLDQYFPPWTTSRHIIYSATGILILAACWAVFVAKKWIQFSFSYLRGYRPKKKR
jgi:hypothetical protein